jgi:filamentous hemagglutinin family protein
MKRAMRRRKTWQRQAAAITAAMMAMSVGGIAYAMPQGEVIRSGKGEITRQDKDMTVNQDSKRLAIDWAGFDIANDERVTFRQPDRDSVALNRVVGDTASVIDGALSGNGHVYVINPNGVLFGKNASVDVGSLVASTARISDRDMTNFADADGITMAIPEDSSAKVINAGTIRAEGGLVVLHAAEVENSGTIMNPEGTTALAAARNLSLSADTAGKINFTVDGALAKAKALNSGMLKADGGYLVMTARSAGDVMSTVVNNTGTMEAKTLRQNEKGEILLDGGDNGVVELSGTIDASGMEAGQSAGSIKAIGAETHVKDGAKLHATGAVDGGLIETSGDYLEIGDNVDIDAAGKTGKAGEWLLDPTAVIINDSGTGEVNGGSTTYLKTSTIADVLRKNNVKIQATDPTYHNADISLEWALNVDETTPGKNTLTLEAEENININADINATAALNVVLNADTNGDDKGGVNINADIRTGGGSLTTGANGATFFGGTKSGENNRAIETSGGNVNIQNEARLQLNGGTLFINTAGGNNTADGNVTFARNVASMNRYEAFMDHDFVEYYSQDHPTGELSAEGQAWENMIKSVYGNPYTNSNGQSALFVIDGQSDYKNLNRSQKIDASNMLAQIWELANLAATRKNNTSDPDGQNLNGQHLVTITDKYENSAAMANAVKKTGNVVEYFTGGKDVTGRTGEAAYMTDGRTFAWVTGPEAGTAFYETTGEGRGYELNGNYTNWVRNELIDPSRPWKGSYNEPNNNRGREHQPYVAIGWTDQNGWDDVGNGVGTVHGFIRETELPNSALSINSGAGKVTVGTKDAADTGRLGSGEGTGLRNLSIETTGDVKVLGSIYVHDNHENAAEDLVNGNVKIATQGNVDVGQITADKKVEIATTGADKAVTVNGKIATDGLVSIEATDDITVHGIENGDKIRLISTNPNGDGAITLANNAEGGGALITKSKANDAVVIDLKGKNASFKNDTNPSKPAVKTGTNGGWKIYAYSPESGDFGTNLNSGTNAQWHATSSTYFAGEHAGNKYIFQVQPTITVKAEDMTKVYGETMKSDDVTTTSSATFVGQDGKPYDVNAPEYANMFNEGELTQYYKLDTPFSSEGFKKKATRDGGINKTDVYEIEANQEGDGLSELGRNSGYAPVEVEGGTVKILKRRINVNGSGSQTYGNATINDWKLTAALTGKQEGVKSEEALVNNDKLDESTGNLSIKSGSSYADNQVGRTTADANPNPYEDAVNMENVSFVGNAGVNYEIVKTQGDLTVNKANLTVNVGNAETVYGTPFDKSTYNYAYSTKKDENLVNGDTKDSLAATLRKAGLEKIGYDNEAALDGTDGKWTASVGDDYHLAFTEETKGAFNALNNYNVSFVDGKAKVTPYTLTEENIVNPDGKPLYTTKYGQTDPFGKATFTGVNGDGMLLLDITDSSALTGAADGRITKDVGDNIYDTTVSLKNLQNKNYQFADGATSKTFEKTASVTPADLTITTENVETEYGTVETTTSEVEGLTNGDLPTGFIYDYGDYGGAYLDGNTKTNNVNTYHFGTEIKTMGKDGLVTPEFLKNYTITGGEADVKIDPKDVTFFVSGTGNTLADVTYTVDPDIDAQLAYGEHVDADYTPGNTLGDNQYGVVAHINGTPIISGNVAGNYRYNYEGLITLSPTVPTKPDIDPHNPSNLDGSGSWTSNMGNHGVPGVERVAGLASAELPFFKVEAGQVSHYGTYDVAADPDKVRLEPTGKRLPEPNQPKTQYREYTKALTTTDGTGMFRMVYDGSTFNITPVDDGALALMRMGDVKNNVELSAEALHAGFSEMGILLEDLDGVYVHFNTMA